MAGGNLYPQPCARSKVHLDSCLLLGSRQATEDLPPGSSLLRAGGYDVVAGGCQHAALQVVAARWRRLLCVAPKVTAQLGHCPREAAALTRSWSHCAITATLYTYTWRLYTMEILALNIQHWRLGGDGILDLKSAELDTLQNSVACHKIPQLSLMH